MIVLDTHRPWLTPLAVLEDFVENGIRDSRPNSKHNQYHNRYSGTWPEQ